MTTVSPALPGERVERATAAGRVAWYRGGTTSGRPLLLVHSVNAVASAYEMRPLYEHYGTSRPVYALDLPGFGASERGDRDYTPRLMTDAVLAVLAEIRAAHDAVPVDALALSLGCEFLARAAVEAPAAFASVGLISPTGFNRLPLRDGAPGSTLGLPRLLAALSRPWLRGRLFRLLTRRAVIGYFLRRTYGGRGVDAGLWDYGWQMARVPGAEFAPIRFLCGCLFGGDSGRLYRALALPVWVVHGVRGDFVDYRGLALVAGPGQWITEVMQTGALPHFELAAEFCRRYDAFLTRRG